MSYKSLTRGEFHAPHHRNPESRMITLIVLVIHLAIQQLHTNSHSVLLGDLRHLRQARDAVRDPVRIAAAGAIAKHRDEIRDLGLGRQRNCCRQLIH